MERTYETTHLTWPGLTAIVAAGCRSLANVRKPPRETYGERLAERLAEFGRVNVTVRPRKRRGRRKNRQAFTIVVKAEERGTGSAAES